MNIITHAWSAFRLGAVAASLTLLGLVAWSGSGTWEEEGHRLVGRAAAMNLPDDMPTFFREAVDQLAYLNVEPDRWKNSEERDIDPALHRSYYPGHYINFEAVPKAALEAPDRLAYFTALEDLGVDRQPGFLPYVILELTQRLRIGFREWRNAADPERMWVEQRIINDAGILGHYVADGSNPLHTSIHHNGWVGDNPHGYATDRGTHHRVEGVYVRTHITIEDVLPRVRSPTVLSELRPDIWQYLGDSFAQVEQLYRLDKGARFDARTTAEANKEFIADRLGAGATMLRDLWWTSWVTSGP